MIIFMLGIAMIRIILIIIVFSFSAHAATTTGGVNWLDTLAYTKPAFYPLTVPDETTSDKYYVDLASGSDSANCTTTGTPCLTMNGLAGKAYSPLRGGASIGAYVYLKGNGYFNLTTSFYGASGKEIVIKPWPGDSTTVYTFTAANCTTSSGPNHIGSNDDPTSVSYVIIDGGPNLQFKFRGYSSTGCNINYSGGVNLNGSYNTVYRCQFTGNGQNNQDLMGIGNSQTGDTFNNLYLINNEWHTGNTYTGSADSDQNYGVYAGGGSSCSAGSSGSTLANLKFINNIFRDLGSLGVQVEPRNASTGLTIEGNAFHNLGKHSCGGNWHCRPAIAVTDSCGGNQTGIIIRNNLIWDVASAGMWLYGGSGVIYNNTIYKWYQGDVDDAFNEAIAGWNSLSGFTVRNNMFDSAGNGQLIFRQTPGTSTNNMCESGKSCGSSSQTYVAAAAVQSTDENNLNFMRIKTASPAIDHGYTTGVTSYYYGSGTRTGTLDIGADEYGVSEGTTPAAANLLGITISGGQVK
jgi:hypothetical protein